MGDPNRSPKGVGKPRMPRPTKAVRGSDGSIVLGDGRADHRGKGATGSRNPQRNHDAEENACYRHANLTAGNSGKNL